MVAKRRNTMQIFPEKARKLWNEHELRALVLFSLSLQILLILIGKWRKYSSSNKIRIVLWLAYLSADSVATVSLGVLSSNDEEKCESGGDDSIDPNNVIKAFWAPFLLLHLGGPDTITAYSLEDNELWLRHLLGLVFQVGVAIYVFLRAWDSSKMACLAIPMFIVGIIKFGERTWILRSASSEHFRESMLPPADPGPNYARYMEDYCAKKEEGFHVESTVIDAGKAGDNHRQVMRSTNPNTELVRRAHDFYQTFRRLCADLILSYHDITKSRSFFKNTSPDNAFKVIELELGFMYDVFYTKAVLIHSWAGAILRCISFSFTVAVFMAFSLFIDKKAYTSVDVVISYILLVGAIILEIYAVIIMLCSDWKMLRLSKHKNVIPGAVRFIMSAKKKRWSNKLSQYNLISICLDDKPPYTKCIRVQRILGVDKLIEKYWCMFENNMSEDLEKLIFEQLQNQSTGNFREHRTGDEQSTDGDFRDHSTGSDYREQSTGGDFSGFMELCSRRGDHVLREQELFRELGWTIKLEFDQSILLWHIATDLCYHTSQTPNDSNLKVSKLLSDYMLYLVVVRPFMLPNGIGQIRFRDTRAEAVEFFKGRDHKKNPKEACRKLLEVSTEVPPSEVKGDRSKSVLFEACILAKTLKKSLKTERQRWELISQLWVEILCYAANQCGWSQHAQQLRRGGELVTHVWLLMAHLGITQQFQISKGHARVKLIVE